MRQEGSEGPGPSNRLTKELIMTPFEAPTRTILDAAPGRTLSFLIGINASLDARAALMARGYTQEEHDRMWSLLGRLTSLPPPSGVLDKKVVAAITELNAWDEPNFGVIAAILV